MFLSTIVHIASQLRRTLVLKNNNRHLNENEYSVARLATALLSFTFPDAHFTVKSSFF